MPRGGIRQSAVRVLAVLVVVAAGSSHAQSQEPSSARAYCLKVAGEKAAEFESMVRDVGLPVEQGRVTAGKAKGFDLLRAVVPLGSAARCDYLERSYGARQPGVVVVRGTGRPRVAERRLREDQLLEDTAERVRGLPGGRAPLLEAPRRGTAEVRKEGILGSS